MDLVSDILRLAEKVAHVPGLSLACSLAIEIMRVAQMAKRNKKRLQSLAHLVADNLIAIADHMDGRWDDVPDKVKGRIDEFEAVLRSISKVVTKYSNTPLAIAFVFAGDRESEITQLEKRLANIQRSMLILLGLDASVALQNLRTGVNQILTAVDPIWLETIHRFQMSLSSNEGMALRLENAMGKFAPQSRPHAPDDTGLRTYTKDDVRLVRKIASRSLESERGNTLTVILHEAQRSTDGQAVFVRSYVGSDPRKRVKMFLRDHSVYTTVWDSIILQLIGASANTLPVPFHVFHAPEGHVENFQDWFMRTLRSNPVETICGLYNMRTSIRALKDFETCRNVRCELFFNDSVVNIRTIGDHMQWALLYTGEIEHGRTSSTVFDQYRWKGYYYHPDIPGWKLIQAFGGGSESWAEGAHGLDALFNCGIPHLDVPALSALLFDNGWLGACTMSLPARTTLGLGDVGYTTTNGNFVVISNLYSLLASANGDSTLTWEAIPYHGPEPWEAIDVVLVERLGKSYSRYERRKYSWCDYTLKLVNLNERQAWGVMQKHACELVTRHAPSLSPHQLKLVTSVIQDRSFEAEAAESDNESALGDHGYRDQFPPVEKISECSGIGHKSIDIDQLGIQGSSNEAAQSHIKTNVVSDQTKSPSFYVFKGDALHVRDSGVPELSPWVRASFQAEPEWLGDIGPFLVDEDEKRLEKKDGYVLSEYLGCDIEYMQLPPGVALPLMEEMSDL